MAHAAACTCDAYVAPGVRPSMCSDTIVDPPAFRTIWARPLIEPPAPAANGVKAPLVTVADSADAAAAAMAAPASPTAHAAASDRVLIFVFCLMCCLPLR